jgi:chromosomal replication initiation ATPase DnaA
LPFEQRANFARSDFVVAPANAEAVAFVDAWPDWPVAAVALHGPSGSGKSHLAATWQARTNAVIVSAAALNTSALPRLEAAPALVVEDIDSAPARPSRDETLFSLLERATRDAPVLLTGHEPPAGWATALPDLASRFRALLAFPLWAPDDDLLAALARKLFADRQLTVPDAVIAHMIRSLERSPDAIRKFVAAADAKALAEHRAVTAPLIREMISDKGNE